MMIMGFLPKIFAVQENKDVEEASNNFLKNRLASSISTVSNDGMCSSAVGHTDSLSPIDVQRLKKDFVASSSVSQVIAKRKGKHPFQGAAFIGPDGIPVVLGGTADIATFKAFRGQHVVIEAINCDTPYGNIIVFLTKAYDVRAIAYTFMPADDPVCRAVLATGKVAFAQFRGNKVSDFSFIDFSSRPLLYKELAALGQIPNRSDFLFHDFDLAFWWLMALPDCDWSREIARRPQDALQTGWGKWVTSFARTFSTRSAIAHAEYLTHGMPAHYKSEKFCQTHPHFYRLLSAIYDAKPLGNIVALAGQALLSAEAADDMLRGIADAMQSVHGDDAVLNVALQALRLSWHVHPAVCAGRRRPWFDARGTMITSKFIDLDPLVLGVTAQNYWRDVDLNWPINHGQVMTGADIPADASDMMQSLGALHFDGTTAAKAQVLSQSLLAEAMEHRQWSVPWGARVQIGIGIFQYVDLYEIGSQFLCMLRDSNNRYLLAFVDVRGGAIGIPQFAQEGSDVELREKAVSAAGIILASIIRDFLVVEDRESVFGQRTRKIFTSVCGNIRPGRSVVYLPRVRYTTTANIQQTERAFSDFRRRSAHEVSGHLRRTSNASAQQIVLAHRHGIIVPAGCTFVRPHRRGQQTGEEVRREYRSRSASRILFPAVDNIGPTSDVASLDFERNIARMMKSLVLQIEHVAASDSGDGGVNVYAYNGVSNEIWAIHCVCFPSERHVGPGIIRHLAGTLPQYPDGTKGMVVTTSSFTKEARDEARKHGFKLVGGAEFAALVSNGHQT
jgi:hypothetical protein